MSGKSRAFCRGPSQREALTSAPAVPAPNGLGFAAMLSPSDRFVTGRLHHSAANASLWRLEPGTGK